MNTEMILVLVLIGLFMGGLVYLEIHSRRNRRTEKREPQEEEKD